MKDALLTLAALGVACALLALVAPEVLAHSLGTVRAHLTGGQ